MVDFTVSHSRQFCKQKLIIYRLNILFILLGVRPSIVYFIVTHETLEKATKQHHRKKTHTHIEAKGEN